jgi:hypothetical protein
MRGVRFDSDVTPEGLAAMADIDCYVEDSSSGATHELILRLGVSLRM